jgi:hypothetical protein
VAANAQVAAYYTAPNSTTEVYAGNQMTQTLDLGGSCDLIYDWTTEITADMITLRPTGNSCSPASCNAGCGGGAPVAGYTYTLSGNTLTATSLAGTLDGTCTSAGLSDPIVFTFTRS